MITRTISFARQLALLAVYSITLSASLWFSLLLRFDFHVPPEHLVNFGTVMMALVALKLLLLVAFGQFGSQLSYFGIHDAQKILAAVMLAALVALGVWYLGGVVFAPSRAVILTDLLVSFLALCALRLGFRLMREGYFQADPIESQARKMVAIVGAGDVGATLAKELQYRRGLGMRPVAFFDDDRSIWGTSIHGVPVKGSPEEIPNLLHDIKIDEAVIAMPRATQKRIGEIVRLFSKSGIKCEIVPSVEQLVTGKVRVSQIRPVDIQDLLGRDPINLETDKIRQLVQGRVVMVTGAGGSIGSELCRQIAGYGPRLLLLVERCEVQAFQIEQELINLGYGSEILPLVADILDQSRMRTIMQRYSPAILFHAAAHKHVPMMEHQPAEAFRNNSTGTRQLADLALEHRVERFVLISTDKAINPTNVMGATKRIAELYLQALQRQSGGTTKFMAVRFGNVLGSSGSVIPTFKKQIAAGGPVTVTHRDVTRYFMTVNEAVGLVLQSATLGSGGEIFVLNMGEPVKIIDLARQLIELSGLQPDTDVEIRVTGLRPGEKLYEELNHKTEDHQPTNHSMIMRFVGEPLEFDFLQAHLSKLLASSNALESGQMKLAIKELVPEYEPHLDSR